MNSWLRKQMAVSLVLLLAAPFVEASTPPQQLSSGSQLERSSSIAVNQPQISDTNTSDPKAATDPNQPVNPESPASTPPQAPTQQGSRPSSDQQQTPPQQPVGTAAAPEEKPVGIAASRPAGAVIAPAKQKRVRIFLIRTAIIAGAAVAVGTVVALSKGSPSRPN